MDISSPLLVLPLLAFVGFMLAVLASRLIASATADVAAELNDPDPDLSRIYRR